MGNWVNADKRRRADVRVRWMKTSGRNWPGCAREKAEPASRQFGSCPGGAAELAELTDTGPDPPAAQQYWADARIEDPHDEDVSWLK